MVRTLAAIFFGFVLVIQLHAQKKLSVLANKPIAEISPAMWGVFFEDINFAADGGLYAELIKNRSFEFYKPMMGWKEAKQSGANGKIIIINTAKENPQNPRFARITVDAGTGNYILSNEGFRGMGIHRRKQYNFSLLAKSMEGNVSIKAELVSNSGKKLGTTSNFHFSNEWKKHSGSFISTDSASKAYLNIIFEGKGTLDLDMISLFPEATWKNRPNGLRADLVQLLADMKPGFIRFPGGCIVEGHELETRYQWKKTVGLPELRENIVNRWNTEFSHRSAPDYYQSFGLGFFEYFQLAEDIGAEPLPILNCGMACQFNTGEVAPLDQLETYIQDAIDLIEFANGPVSSKWGKLRADMGHPGSFNLKLLGIGNEQWDEQYIERYRQFAKRLKAKHPEIKLISSSGPSPDGPRFEYLWNELRKENADLVDEHYYKDPNWFFSNASRYDNYDRSGPKVFAGEYAAHSKEDKDAESRNTWYSAIAEAAFMTGLERNADIIRMASYAPLFAHVEAWQWRPDLIWFDNLRVVGTPNYYVQKLFAVNRGTHAVPILQDGKLVNGKDSIYASAVIDKAANEIIIKIVNSSGGTVSYDVNLVGAILAKKNADVQMITASIPFAYNSLDHPQTVFPKESIIDVSKKVIVELPPMSLYVIKLQCKWK